MPLVEAKTSVSLKNILFPTDFSEVAAAALPYAAGIARRYGSTVYLAHVVAPNMLPIAPPDGPPIRSWDIAEREMAILDRSDLLSGVPFESILVQGELSEALLQVIAENEVDLIVLATSGHGGFRRLILGSVAEELVREAPCPVLTVGPSVPHRKEWSGEIKHVLFATDFRPGSLAALMYAVFFAEENGAQLTLLHVSESREEGIRQRIDEARWLRRLAEMVPSDNCLVSEPKFLLEFGDAGDTVVRTARQEHADLIVMGARETIHHWMHQHFSWTTLHRILANAECPVLTVKG